MSVGRSLARSGPDRREYQRARYLASRLASTVTSRDAVAATVDAGRAIDDLVATASAYADLYARQPTDRAGHQLFAAVSAVGHHLAAVADQTADCAISSADCARPHITSTTVSVARAKLNEDRARWTWIRAQTSDMSLTDDELAADPTVPVNERRWRQHVLDDYRRRTDTFLTAYRQAFGRDQHWEQRSAIRAYSYTTVLGTDRNLSGGLADRLRPDLDDLYRTHRVSLPGPQVCASVQTAPLAVGENALRTGALGGLVGDGWRTADPHHRAFILGAWRVP